MQQAIHTKTIGPTNTRGIRIRATAFAGSLITNWDHSLSPEENHQAAADALVNKLGWGGRWIGGQLGNNSYAFVVASTI